MALSKVSVIGGGYVGGTAARILAQTGIASVSLFDVVEDLTHGKSLDLRQASAITRVDTPIRGVNVELGGDGHEYEALRNSEVVVITSGRPRQPGMSRDDLLRGNAQIVGGIVDKVKIFAPNAILILVTNPLDSMCQLAQIKTRWGQSRVMGMAGVLDSARMSWFIAEALHVSVKDIRAMVLGGHGDTMVPLPRYTTVGGIPVTELLPEEKLQEIFDRTRKGGAEIVNLYRNHPTLGSAYHAPAQAIVEMVSAVILDEHRLLPVAVYTQGEYGIGGIYQGLPVCLGAGGVEKVIELQLTDEERALLQASTEHVQKNDEDLRRILDL